LRLALLTAIQDNSSFDDRFDAEVWLMDMSNRLRKKVQDTHERIELLKLIHGEAARAKVPPELVLAVIEVESNFDRWAVSSAGAQGLMQVMPFWLEELGRPHDSLQQPQTNLRLGCTILRYYLDRERGDLKRALARYNGSPLINMNDYPQRVLDALRVRWYRQ
jgi:soluble lytic murein transglycosylase-like protein